MALAFKILPKNYLSDWGEFESWALGVGSQPDGWLVGSAFIVGSDATNKKYGNYGAMLVGSGAQGVLYRSIPEGADLAGKTFKLAFWGKADSTAPYAQIFDGVTQSTVHFDSSGAFVELTTPSHKLDVDATELTVKFFATANQTVYMDSAVLVEGEELFTTFDDEIVISQWQPVLSMRSDNYEVAGRQGAISPEVNLRATSISVKGSVIGSDVNNTRDNFDTLMKSIVDWKRGSKKSFYLYEDRLFDCFLNSFNYNHRNGMKFIDFTMRLNVPEATMRGIGRLRHRQVISGTVTEFNLDYNGSEVSLPVVSFVADQGGAITTCNLENLTTGQNMVYTGTVPTNVALDVDCFNGTVLASSVDSIANFSGSDFIQLVRGTNYFKFSGSNCTIHVDYFERFL